MIAYLHPKALPRSTAYTLKINGRSVETLHTDVADFAICALETADFPAQVEVVTSQPLGELVVRPLSKGIVPERDAATPTIRFKLQQPARLSIDPGYGRKPLYLFANPPETNPPAPDTPGLVTLPAGQVTEFHTLELTDGQTLYLPGGSVLKGRVQARGAKDIRICGHGIIDGSYFPPGYTGVPHGLLLAHDCSGVLIEGVTFLRTYGWTLMLAASRNATVRDVQIISEMQAGDGIDVVGCRDVLIEDSFIHANDDCIVIKSLDTTRWRDDPAHGIDGRRPVDNILSRRCTLANWHAGNAMEIGHELCTDTIANVVFRDIDVLHVHGTGAVFSIHNVDRAEVRDVLWEDIRIEHCYDKLIDFRVTTSRYSTEVAPTAAIRRVTLRNIRWHTTPFNAGYTSSLISGRAADQPVEDITIENFFIDGKPVRHLDELDIHTRHVNGLRLIVPDNCAVSSSRA